MVDDCVKYRRLYKILKNGLLLYKILKNRTFLFEILKDGRLL